MKPWVLMGAAWGCSDLTQVLANIYVRERFLSGGVMIRRNIVLTTALYVQHKMEDIAVALQRHPNATMRDLAPRLEVIGIALHPDFKHTREPINNIALLMVESSEPLACEIVLDTRGLSRETGDEMVLVGWGYTKGYWEEVEALKQIRLPVLFFYSCYSIILQYSRHALDVASEMCAGQEAGDPDAAVVAHGSPLFYIEDGVTTLVGVHSFNVLSKDLVYSPCVFSRIHHFVPWILETLRGDDPGYE